MNADDKRLLKEIKARLPTIELIDDEGESLGVADDLAELLAMIETHQWSDDVTSTANQNSEHPKCR